MQSIKSKRALAVSSALALVLALGACTTDDDDPNGTTDDGIGGTTATTLGDLGGTTLPDTGTTAP